MISYFKVYLYIFSVGYKKNVVRILKKNLRGHVINDLYNE
jgi:hypothetical protein